MSAQELKPCAHCGGNAEVRWYDGFPSVSCKQCGVNTGLYLTEVEGDAIATWNTRTDDALRAQRDALLEVMTELFERGDVQILFAGNPIACDALEAKARAAIAQAQP